MDKLDLLIGMLKEIKEDFKEHELADREDFTHIKDKLEDNTADLKHHIRRTDLLEKLHKDNEARIEILEQPKKAKQYLLSAASEAVKLFAPVLSLLAILKYLGKL